MTDDAPGRYRVGETALLAEVAEAEPLVGEWRRRFDPSDPAGIPAHVTVLYPFLDIERVDAAVTRELGSLFGGHRPFTVRFGRCARFPEVLYLAPSPDLPFRALTGAVATQWPEAPPYGGQFAEAVPHLTVVHGRPSHTFDEVEAQLAPALPVTATIESVSLYVRDGARWHRRAAFPLLA